MRYRTTIAVIEYFAFEMPSRGSMEPAGRHLARRIATLSKNMLCAGFAPAGRHGPAKISFLPAVFPKRRAERPWDVLLHNIHTGNMPAAAHMKEFGVFSIGDLVVYPAQGVGKIESIEQKVIRDIACAFYIVRILSNNITLMVPVANARNVGLRALTPPAEAGAILSGFTDHSAFSGYTGQNWNRRYREYTERLKKNELTDVANVLHELLLIGRNKELSFGERRLLEQAMSLVGGELAVVLKTPEQEIRSRIQKIFAPPPAEEA